ncbi:sialidase-3-like isoform X2 [Mobula hypostoma]|uniref:sialidase-3-like isoform X2 n=1 Tax=Mobula hypostoma TaxID=723540 RepID=UPI002FC30B0A
MRGIAGAVTIVIGPPEFEGWVTMATDQISGAVTLFEKKKSGTVYRIPSLLYLERDAVFLAFAEKRNSSSDVNAKSLVLRRGTFYDGTVKWEDEVKLEAASLAGYRSMNPCPVYERQGGKVYLFFNCIVDGVSEWQQVWRRKNAARLCYVLSQDAGLSWSGPWDVTEKVIGHRIRHWATFSVGPGHGVQTEGGTLVIPAYAYMVWQRCCLLPACLSTHPHPFYFYSEDGGVNWAVGEPLTKYRGVECEMAEITIANHNRVLYCNSRTSGQGRVEAISLEPGYFEIARLDKGLPESKGGCQGSVASFPTPNGLNGSQSAAGDGLSWLLYTHPCGERKFFWHCHNRTNLGIFLNTSPLRRGHWHGPWVIQAGPCGYSDLAYVHGARSFACLYECGTCDSWEQITFCLFTVSDVMKNIIV